MIHRETLLRVFFDERNGGGKLAFVNQDVIREIKLCESGDSAGEILPQEKIIGFCLGNVAKPAEPCSPRIFFEMRRDVWGAKVHPADNAADCRIAIR